MTSLRYSNDKADRKDFARSLLKACPYSVIALIVLLTYFTIPVIKFVNSDTLKQTIAENGPIISYFGNAMMVDSFMIVAGMVCCGILTAIILFRFMFSKNSVNVYFSMGITRSRLFFNRIFAAMLTIFIAVTVPLTITLFVNISVFGYSKHLINLFFYFFLVLFTSGLSGLTIGAFASTVSGSIIEAVLTSASTSLFPFLFVNAVGELKYSMLNGFYGMEGYTKIGMLFNLLCPFTFVCDLNVERMSNDQSITPIDRLSELLCGKEVPKDMAVDFDLLAPLIFWLIVSMALIAIGFTLMNRRKAENSNSFGKFGVATAINGIAVYSFAFLAAAEPIFNALYGSNTVFFHNTWLTTAVLFVILIIAFLLGELIMIRKLKPTLRRLPVFAFMFAITIFCIVFVSSEYFGTYNRLPDTSEIKLVSMDIHDRHDIFNYFSGRFPAATLEAGAGYSSKDAEDIKLITEIFNSAKESKYKKSESNDGSEVLGDDLYFYNDYTFNIVLKNGKIIQREFVIYDLDTAEKISRQIYDSKYYKNFLKAALCEQPDTSSIVGETDSGDDLSYDYNDPQRYSDLFHNGQFTERAWHYIGNSSMYTGFVRSNEGAGYSTEPIADTKALCKALYEDLIKLPYDKFYNNTSRPLAALTFNDNTYCAYYLDEEYASMYGDLNRKQDADINYGDPYSDSNKTLYNELNKKYNTGAVGSCIYIYPEMTNTIKFLKDNGYETVPFNAKVKEVYYADSKINLTKLAVNELDKLTENGNKNSDRYRYYIPRGESYVFEFNDSFTGSYFTYCFWTSDNAYDMDSSYKITLREMFNKLIDGSEVKFNKITDQRKAEQIVSKCVPFFSGVTGDNGRYVYIVYDNGVICEEYLPSQNLSVIK